LSKDRETSKVLGRLRSKVRQAASQQTGSDANAYRSDVCDLFSVNNASHSRGNMFRSCKNAPVPTGMSSVPAGMGIIPLGMSRVHTGI